MRAGIIRLAAVALLAAGMASTPAAAVPSKCNKAGLHYCTGKCRIGDSNCFANCRWGWGCGPPPSGGQKKASVKAQQPPSVWSGSTHPTDGNKTNKGGGPIH
jgi:hypothetical protein